MEIFTLIHQGTFIGEFLTKHSDVIFFSKTRFITLKTYMTDNEINNNNRRAKEPKQTKNIYESFKMILNRTALDRFID